MGARAASNSVTMHGKASTPPASLRQGLAEMVRKPLTTLVPPWSWKAAACTALFRALAFFVSNLRSGSSQATKAMLVEAIFAVFAGGLIGAISQFLRRAKPLWATAIFVCLALPALMTVAQFGVHILARTPHQSSGIVVSFCLATLAAAFTWYAMRHGALLGGNDETTVREDMHALPQICAGFALSVPRWIAARLSPNH